MAIIHFMYTNEKRVVSIVRAAQRKPVERQPKHPVHAGRDGERPQDECSFSFYNNRKSPKRTDRTVFPHPARTVRRAAARHRTSANKLCTDDSSEQLITLHHKPSPDHRRKKEQNDITLRIPVRHAKKLYPYMSYTIRVLKSGLRHLSCFTRARIILCVFADVRMTVMSCFAAWRKNCLICLLNIDGHRSTPPFERSWRRMSETVRRPTHMTRRARGRVSWFSVHLSCFYPSVVIGVSSAVAPSEPEAARDVAVSARLNRCHSVGDIPVNCLNLRTKYAGSS